MNVPSYIMIADSGFLEFLPIVIVVALGLGGKIVQKIAARKQQEEAERRAQSDREERARQGGRPTPPVQRPPQRAVQKQPAPSQSARRGPYVAPPQPQKVQRPAQRQRVSAPAPQVQPRVIVEEAVVHEPLELREMPNVETERIVRQEKQRTRRLAPPKVPEADTKAIQARLASARPATEAVRKAEVPDEAQAAGLSLHSRDLLRSAIIAHEIFSPPKALRKEQELWQQ